jgi:hypothetical protein
MAETPRILYCHCANAQVVPLAVKTAVLGQLCASAAAFEAVADLCGMSARQDPALKWLAAGGSLKIAACYPRAIKGLFAAAKTPLSPDRTEVLNMRVLSAEEVTAAILDPVLKPNLPAGRAVPSPAVAGAEGRSAAPASKAAVP